VNVRWGVWPPEPRSKKSQKVSDSHRNDVSPLTQGLRYRAACDNVSYVLMSWFIIHKTLQWLYLFCYYFVLVALFVVYICTRTLFSFYARHYVFTSYVTVCECHIALKATWLDLTYSGSLCQIKRSDEREYRHSCKHLGHWATITCHMCGYVARIALFVSSS